MGRFLHHYRLQAVALLTWAVVGIPGVLALLEGDGSLPLRVVWAVAYVLFAVGFLVVQLRAPRRETRWLLLQVVCALVVLAARPTGFEAALLTLTAVQAPFFGRRPLGWVWVGAQTLGALVIYLQSFPVMRALLVCAVYLGFQAFAMSVARLARSEAEARAELAAAHVALKAAQADLVEREGERQRLDIARELHDSLGHHLTALSLNLEAAAYTVQGPGAEHVRRAQEVARRLLGDVRAAVTELRESGPEDVAPALRALASGVPGLRVSLSAPEVLVLESAGARRALLRCVQEALTNSLRHAHASEVWLEVRPEAEGIRVTARDDGPGLAGPVVPGSGLSGMRERASSLGGRLEVRTGPGRGVELEAWFPCQVVRAEGAT
ncbi:sensor histidine kinase [Archangium minus]|uniref:Sensor histidine kinase n=1 Tax=Archangium minus TaxID=83450 RepID=A0ABY9X962_9BACT|nr:sensor histidine kinase [Archangium minus]